ncbi:MAG: hypothetical protein RLN76_01360 [Phycisphaeraceae bacterium]
MSDVVNPMLEDSDLDRFVQGRYLLRKKFFRVFGDDFSIFDEEDRLAFYCRLKALRLREDIRVFADRAQTRELLAIKARTVLDFGTTYDVTDSVSWEPVGSLRRKGFKSMMRDEWAVLTAEGEEMGTIREDSLGKAIARRIVGDISFFMPQAYHATIGEVEVATFRQRFNPLIAKIDFDFSMDHELLLDRRLGIAAGLLLGAIEGRQD